MKPLHVLLVGIGWIGFALPAAAQNYADVSTEALIDRVVSGHLASPLERIELLEKHIQALEQQNAVLKSEVNLLKRNSGAPVATTRPTPPVVEPTRFESRQVRAFETLTGIAEEYGLTVRELAKANQKTENAKLQNGEWLLIPRTAPKPKVIEVSRNQKTHRTYLVAEGDTLTSIATKFGLSYEAIRQANQLTNIHHIEAGQVLTIPLPRTTVAPQAPQTLSPELHRYYDVKTGDTIYSISRKFFTTEDTILRLNNLPPDGAIRAGELLIVPITRYQQLAGQNTI